MSNENEDRPKVRYRDPADVVDERIVQLETLVTKLRERLDAVELRLPAVEKIPARGKKKER